jgi:hypothetical protein
MVSLEQRRVATWRELVCIAILGPLLLPAALLAIRVVSGIIAADPAPAADWLLLLVVGPAIPLYVALLPLLPLGIARLHRGWRPRRASLLAACIGLALLMDGLFYLAAD